MQMKVLSVGTSNAWREYHVNKENQQQKLIEEKEERKRKGKENKLLAHARKLLKNHDFEEKDQAKKLQAMRKNTKCNIGEYVIVSYESNLYLSLITSKKEENIILNAMTQ